MPSSTPTTRPTSPRGAFLRGIRLGFPIFLGYAAVGAAFGVIAVSIGFEVWHATVCSATALAGAGQFIALALMRTGESVFAVLAATTVVNLRYVLFGATMSPYLSSTRTPLQAVLAFTLTDETFAVNIADRRAGLSTGASMAGVGAIAWMGWVLGTTVGAAATGWIGDPSRWGVDFAMPAMFTVLLIALAEDRRHAIIGGLAAGVALILPMLAQAGIDIPSAWHIILSAVIAATVATVVFRDE